MKFLIQFPTSWEYDQCCESLPADWKQEAGTESSPYPHSSFQFGTVELIVVASHVGPASVASIITAAISRFKPQAVIALGSAGALEPQIQLGSLTIANYVQALFDQETLANRMTLALPPGGIRLMVKGRMENHTNLRSADWLVTLAEESAVSIGGAATVIQGIVGSCDGFYSDPEILNFFRAQGPIVQDLESVSAATAAVTWGIPFIAMKYVVTNAFKREFEAKILRDGTLLSARYFANLLEVMARKISNN